jgi:DNA-binding response OmpR family regulator
MQSQPIKLLVVDDSRTVRLQVERILTNAGYDVITAEDGLEAIEHLQQQPSLMVLDVTMPRLDGYGVVERLKQLGAEFERLPIVFLTSLESRAMELLGREYGAYLHKPVCEQQLLSVVKSQLELVSQTTF